MRGGIRQGTQRQYDGLRDSRGVGQKGQRAVSGRAAQPRHILRRGKEGRKVNLSGIQ